MNRKLYKVVHPGVFLKQEIDKRRITQVELADEMEMQPPHISGLINGHRHISANLALKLEKLLGIDALVFMEKQMIYDLESARKNQRVRRKIN